MPATPDQPAAAQPVAAGAPAADPVSTDTPPTGERAPTAEPAASPSATDAAAPATETEPPAPTDVPADASRRMNADTFHVEAEKVFVTENALAAEGKVVVRTEDYTISADMVEVDRRSEIARFKGHVVIEGRNQRTQGTDLWVDLDSGWWRIEGAETRVEPQFFAEGVLEPLFARGAQAEYQPDENVIRLRDGRMSSCDLWRHYEFRSPSITIRPEDKVKLRNPSLYVYGHRAIRYPFDLTYSLREEQQRIFPEIGENDVEGRFLKLAGLYYMGLHNNGVARLHLTEKRGLGLGFDHLLQDARQTLDFSIFDEPSEGALSVRTGHSYAFSRSFSSDLSANYQTNSGYLYSSKTLSSNLSFRNTDADSDTTLGFQNSLTSSGYGSSRRFGSTVYHSQRLGQDTSWSLRDTYLRSRYATQDVADQELNTDFQLRHRARSFDLEMQATKRNDLDGSDYAADDRYYSLDRLPAIAVNTDTDRLGDRRLFGRIHTRLRGEVGYFRQQPDDSSIIRTSLTTDLGGYEHALDPHTRYRTGLRFRQSWFDDGSAQYNSQFDAQLRHALDGHWQTRLSYNHAATRGFAPLRLDYGGRSHETLWQLVRLVPDRSRFELSSGFDFIADEYRDLRILAELRSSAHSYWRLQSAYSFDRSQWWPAIVRYTTARDSLYLDLTGRYDLDRSKLSTITADLDWRFHRWWRLEFVGSYSGFTHQLDQADVRLTRDWHCLVAQATYTKWPRELSFALGIKAFPATPRTLGIGATGAYLPGAPGEYY